MGDGPYSSVNDGESLRQALNDIGRVTAFAQTRASSLASATVGGQLTAQPASALMPRLTVPANPQTPWRGALYRFQLMEERQLGCDPLTPSWGDRNLDGDCDDTLLLDADGDWVGENASGQFVKLLYSAPAQPFWEAGQVLKPSTGPTTRWQSRRTSP